jgi:Cytotoxic
LFLYEVPPKTLPGFPGAAPTKPKTPFGGGGNKKRKRWIDTTDGTIYEWDYQHGRVEKYDKRGQHLGEFDYQTGEKLKDADPERSIEP